MSAPLRLLESHVIQSGLMNSLSGFTQALVMEAIPALRIRRETANRSIVLRAQAEGCGLEAIAHVDIVVRLDARYGRLAVIRIAGLPARINHFGEGHCLLRVR